VWAILSCIHANLEALDAVLLDLDRVKPAGVICLGDVVGYGPNPRECLDLSMNFLTLLGNHDQALMFDPDGFGVVAERSILWTRRILEEPDPGRERRWQFLAERPRSHRDGEVLFVHGSPRNPLHEYVFAEDIYNARKMERIFALMDRYCFNGHTHIPGVFINAESADQYLYRSPEELNSVHRLDGRKTIVNVGSVGQPRDGDWRACYVLFDGERVWFRRVEYDVGTTVRKIHDIPDLENFLGDRLREGR
jgi:diadenosine tetraphosphatase ApaH/serine/threonine PP2A family protein phosphatase